MLGVLIFDTLPGLFIGIGMSLVLLLYRAYRPHIATLGLVPGSRDQYGDVARHPENALVPGVPILRVDSPLFFANAEHVRATVRDAAAQPDARAVILDMEATPSVDVSAIRMLAELREDLTARGSRLVLARNLGQVRELMRRELGEGSVEDVYPNVAAAVAALQGGTPPDPTDGTAP
ncbi:MAG: STAS domain-containing protein [Chloroflexota bacterium]